MDTEYTNREIDHSFKEIKDQLNRIEQQTIKTNGRVSKLESWKAYLVGAWFIVTAFLIPMIVWTGNVERGALKEQIKANRANIELLTKGK